MPAWATAAMLDYVFTDDRRAIWDNNGGNDFHTLLKEYASGEQQVAAAFGGGCDRPWMTAIGDA